MSWYNTIGYALSNTGLMESVEEEVRLQHPNWKDDKVIKEVQKVLKKATLFNAKNKKPKKAKKPKKDTKWL